VWIPALMRDLTQGQESVTVPGARVREVIEALELLYPGVKARLCDGEELRSGMVVVVDTEAAPLGLAQPVGEASEVHFLPAIGGG
jgi:sulfur-carrier protein